MSTTGNLPAATAVTPPPWNYTQAFQYWIAGGGSPLLAPIMAAIAIHEGPNNSSITDTNGLPSVGLFQINGSNFSSLESAGIITQQSDLLNPITNAKAAAYVLASQGLDAWGSWNVGPNGTNSAWGSVPAANAALIPLVNAIGASNIQKGNISAAQTALLTQASGQQPGSLAGATASGGPASASLPGASASGGTTTNPPSNDPFGIKAAIAGIESWVGNNVVLPIFVGSLALAFIAGGVALIAASNNTVRDDVQKGAKTAAEAAEVA